MAVKKKNALVLKADFNDVRWINTPFAYTEFCSGLTLLQQDIMYKVSDSIQSFFKSYFDNGRNKSKEIPRPLFTPEDKAHSLAPVRVVLADYGISSNHYDYIEKAVKDILGIQVRVPGTNKSGERVMKWVNIFTEGETPLTEDGYTYLKDGEIMTVARSKGWLDFRINPDVADYVFDMAKGYINHPNVIARISTANHTPQLYGLILHKCGKSGKGRLTVNEIKEHLGLVYYNEDDHSIKGYMLPKYSQFKKCVLLKVQDDLNRMAEENLIDYIFTFQEIMKPGRKTGDPLFIEVKLVRTKLGTIRDMAKHRNSANKQLIETLLQRCGDLKREAVEPIITTVSDEDFADFSMYVYRDIPHIIEKKYPENVAAYIVALMCNWLKSREERKRQAERDLFSQLEEKPKAPERPIDIPDNLADLWQKLLAAYDGPFKPYLVQAHYKGTHNGFPCIEFPTKQLYDDYCALESKQKSEERRFSELCQSIFGPLSGRILVRGYANQPR